MKKIDRFDGNFCFLSNFYPATVELEDGIVYPTSEHAFQAMKTTNMDERRAVAVCATPGQSKRKGRKVPLRPDWEDIKIAVMETVVRAKFQQHQDLEERLIQTGNAELIEGNTWQDRFWGVCGTGENHLGKILMKIRDDLTRQ